MALHAVNETANEPLTLPQDALTQGRFLNEKCESNKTDDLDSDFTQNRLQPHKNDYKAGTMHKIDYKFSHLTFLPPRAASQVIPPEKRPVKETSSS